MTASARRAAASTAAMPTPRPEVRAKVMDLLGNTQSFQALPQDRQKQVLHDTALIADALVGKGEPGPITRKIQETYFAAVKGEIDRYKDWNELVR